MFPNSSQAKFWMFENEAALSNLRAETNREYVASHQADIPQDSLQTQDRDTYFLSVTEEAVARL